MIINSKTDPIRIEIAKLASVLFNQDITESMVGIDSNFRHGDGRYYKAYVVNGTCDMLMETKECASYKGALASLYRKIKVELNKGENK